MATMQQEAPPERPDAANRRAWWTVGGALTAAVMAASLLAAGVWVWTLASPVSSESHTETYAGPVSGVEVNVAVGSVALTAAEGQDLEVRRESTWQGPEPGFEETLREDGTFSARGDCAEDIPFWFGADECEIDYELAVPSGAWAAVHTSVGPIEAEGLDGDIELSSSVGDIDAQNLRASSTEVRTSVGDVTLAFDQVLGDVEVSTSTGDVTILVPDDGATYDVQFISDVGDEDIDIATEPRTEADYLITVYSSVGSLEVRYAP